MQHRLAAWIARLKERLHEEAVGAELALIESQVIELIANAHGAAQREDWAEVLDCSGQLENLLARAKGKVAARAAAAR